jgi:diadenosine tetraphosphate (Ap4A) HIT family hydrolase
LNGFKLNEKLNQDTYFIANLGLCQLRLMNDRHWPWLILIPQRPHIEEIFDLTPLDQAMLTFETNLVAQSLKLATGATKMNVGALGNIVRQLHVHVIARHVDDPNWPGPIWGYGQGEAYEEAERQVFAKTILGMI